MCKNSQRLIPFSTVNPFEQPQPAKYVEKTVRELGCKGLKLCPSYQYFYPNDPLVYPIYAKAEELGIPVMFHTGSSVFHGSRLKYADPLLLDDIAVDFPDLTILMAHSGRPFWYDRAFFLARLHENVYLELSGLPPQKLLTYFPDLERIPEKIVFGSDWPGIRDVSVNVEAIRQLPLRETTKEKILGENAARILGISQGEGKK
jgi:predicted TIM-barrel fold metal-dependent hydrolase